MMSAQSRDQIAVADAAEVAARELVKVTHWGDSSFLNLPLIYPDGSSVTVKIDRVQGGLRVSDNAFAFRLVEGIGAHRSYARCAKAVAERADLCVEHRMIYADVSPDFLVPAICEVAAASWQVADRIFENAADAESEELEATLRDRLAVIFPGRLERETLVTGASSHKWEVSAVVRLDSGLAVFQAVGSHMSSVNKASTSFLDFGNLQQPPHLVAVVREKRTMAEKLTLISQAGGRVIEQEQPDAAYLRAAA